MIVHKNLKISSVETGTVRELFGEGGREWLVVAETLRGDLYIHHRDDLTEDEAKMLARRVEAAGRINVDHWNFWRVRYGSEAYLEEEREAAFMLQGGARIEDLPANLQTLY